MEPEALDSGTLAKFDSMMKEFLQKIGIGEGKDDIIVQCGSVRIRVFEAGEYERKDKPLATGGYEKVKYEPGVELRQGGLVLHVEPSDLAQLVYQMKNHEKLNQKLNERLEKEKQLMRSLGFS